MATAEFIILIGLLGLAVGSFFNVCIDRLPKSLSIVALPSHCERCPASSDAPGPGSGAQLPVVQGEVSLL